MANTRELSQLASLINVIDENKSIGIVTSYPNANVGVGTLSPTSKVSVVGDVSVSGVITATSFSGDGSNLTGLSVDANATVSISTNPPQSPSVGDMWYSITHARTFIYYQDEDSFQWIDSAPFNTGISSASGSGGSNVSIGSSAPSSPNNGDLWYSTTRGRLFIYYTDTDSSQWIDSAPFRTGIVTSTSLATNAEGLVGTPNLNVGIVTASGGFTSDENSTPIQISLNGNQLTFTASGIGSTTITLN